MGHPAAGRRSRCSRALCSWEDEEKLTPSWYPFDLRTGWNLTKSAYRRRLWATLEEEDPWVIIGPPMTLTKQQAVEYHKDPEKRKMVLQEGVGHFQFAAAAYKWQVDRGRHFVHQHLEKSVAWGWDSKDDYGNGWCGLGGMQRSQCLREGKKIPPVKWVSNSPCILDELANACLNFSLQQCGSDVSSKQTHPEELANAILKGIRRQVQSCGCINSTEVCRNFDEPESPVAWKLVKHDCDSFYDGHTGLQLDTAATHLAMAEELKCIEELGLWCPVPPDHFMQRLGTPPIPTRWELCKKGDDERPDIRARLVVQETRRRSTIAAGDIAATLSATPPVEALRMVLSMTMMLHSDPADPIVVKQVDTTRAHPHVDTKRENYVVPPKQMGFDEKKIMELLKDLYGIRDPGQGFEFIFVDVIVKHRNFAPRGMIVFVHGEDFSGVGARSQLKLFALELAKNMLVNGKGTFDPDQHGGDLREIRVLKRTI